VTPNGQIIPFETYNLFYRDAAAQNGWRFQKVNYEDHSHHSVRTDDLFAGGCTVLAGAAGPVAIIPAGVVVLNVLVIRRHVRLRQARKVAFYTLAILDGLAVILLTVAWFSFGTTENELNILALLLISAFTVKGALTFVMGSKIVAEEGAK
jgi:hypothetical protein